MEWREPPPDGFFQVWELYENGYRLANVSRCGDGAQVGLKLHCYLSQHMTGRAASIAQGKRFAERWTAAYIKTHPLEPRTPPPALGPLVRPVTPPPPPDMPWVGKRQATKRRR